MSQSQKEAAEYAEVLLAYSRGEQIQVRYENEETWAPITYPLWDFGHNDYRIAPKPVEEWRWLFSNGQTSSVYPTKESLIDIFRNTDGRPVLMREVTE